KAAADPSSELFKSFIDISKGSRPDDADVPGFPGLAARSVGLARVWRQAPAGSRLAMPPCPNTMCEGVSAGNEDSRPPWLFRPDVAAWQQFQGVKSADALREAAECQSGPSFSAGLRL
ncbi:hypothetical protein, partial [Methylobacterium longum]